MTYEGMLAETIAFRGHKGDVGEAYPQASRHSGRRSRSLI